MKNLVSILGIALLFALLPAEAANLTQTTLAANVTATAMTINVASTTGITAPTNGFMQKLYVIDPGGKRGELMTVTGAPNGNYVPVARVDEFVAAHLSGSIVLIAPVDPTQGGFFGHNPSGYSSATPITLPFVNINTGDQYLLSKNNVWVGGWNKSEGNIDVTAAVASAAGAITPSGPLFHVTGALAVTGFNIPVGFAGGCFTIISDGAWTWTTAGNIALASASGMTAGQSVTFCYDANSAKFYPDHQ